MPNFATQLKSEIERLVAKAVRSETKAIKQKTSQYRTEIASLKRRMASMETLVKKAAKSSGRVKTEPPRQGSETNLRFRAGGFASLRKKLDLNAAQMGKLLGVSGQSVYHWEAGKSRPRQSQLPAIAAVRKMGKRDVAARLSQD